MAYSALCLCPQQTLAKCKQRLIDLKNIIFFPPDEIPDNHIEFAVGAEGVARLDDEIAGLVQVQFVLFGLQLPSLYGIDLTLQIGNDQF